MRIPKYENISTSYSIQNMFENIDLFMKIFEFLVGPNRSTLLCFVGKHNFKWWHLGNFGNIIISKSICENPEVWKHTQILLIQNDVWTRIDFLMNNFGFCVGTNRSASPTLFGKKQKCGFLIFLGDLKIIVDS